MHSPTGLVEFLRIEGTLKDGMDLLRKPFFVVLLKWGPINLKCFVEKEFQSKAELKLPMQQKPKLAALLSAWSAESNL